MPSAPGLEGKRCQEFQFVASIPFTDEKGAQKTTDAYLWIPRRCQKIRGVVLAQQNAAEQSFVEHAAIRQACLDTDQAIVWFYPGFAPTFKNPAVDGAALQNALEELGRISGYAEIATAPWLPFGHSTMGQFSQQLANWKPERCIAQICFKTSVDLTLPNNRQVPLFELGGQYTEWNQHKKDWITTQPNFWGATKVPKDRAQTGRPFSFALQCGSSHFVMSEEEAGLMALYLRKAVKARVPTDGGPLKPVDIEGGWVADLEMSNLKRTLAQPVKSAPAAAKNGVWFFDQEMAQAVETLMTLNWTRKTQIPVILGPDGAIPSMEDSGIFRVLPPVVGANGISLTFKTGFLDRVPAHFTTGSGQPLGHSAKGEIQIGWLVGNAILTGPNSLRMTVDRRRTLYSSMIYVQHPGDEVYRPSIQPFNVGLLNNKTGKAQSITFPAIPDQPAGTPRLELNAVSDSGLPVDYTVIVGPATVAGGVLTFTPLPPRTLYPVKGDGSGIPIRAFTGTGGAACVVGRMQFPDHPGRPVATP